MTQDNGQSLNPGLADSLARQAAERGTYADRYDNPLRFDAGDAAGLPRDDAGDPPPSEQTWEDRNRDHIHISQPAPGTPVIKITPRVAAAAAIASVATRSGYNLPYDAAERLAEAALSAAASVAGAASVEHIDHIHVGPFNGPPDLSRFRDAVRLRDRCRAAAVEGHERAGLAPSATYANATYDAIAELIREDERGRAG